jgi:modulator of FtsH protease
MPSDNPFATSSSRRASLSVFDTHTPERAISSTFLLGQVMFLVAVAIGFAAAGTYLGRDLAFGTAEICEFGFLGMVFAQMFVRPLREGSIGMAWLFALALLLGIGMGPVIAEYATY